MVGRFMAAIPISTVTGAPVSGLILGMDGIWGLRGWQWLFICEGLPTVLLGVVVILHLTDGPEEASWLQADERDWLIDGNAFVVTAPPGPAYRPFRPRHRRFVEPCR